MELTETIKSFLIIWIVIYALIVTSTTIIVFITWNMLNFLFKKEEK
jgi:hypothetical protein